MPRFIINIGAQRNQVLELRRGEHVIGRESDAGISLPNVSVSRQHAKLKVDAKGAELTDLESGNGTLLNGQPLVGTVRLKTRDEVRIGKYTLVYLSDARGEDFYRGRAIRYMAAYEPGRGGEVQNVETFMLSKDALKAMATQGRILENGRMVSVRDPSKFWYPEDKGLSFGSGEGMIRPAGWFIWGLVAQVSWQGNRHVVEKKAFWVSVLVNDEPVEKQPLKHGDRVQIGDTRFRYESD